MSLSERAFAHTPFAYPWTYLAEPGHGGARGRVRLREVDRLRVTGPGVPRRREGLAVRPRPLQFLANLGMQSHRLIQVSTVLAVSYTHLTLPTKA